MKVRQHVLAHELDHFELLVILHAWPAHAKDEKVRVQALSPALKLLDHIGRTAEDEAVARQRSDIRQLVHCYRAIEFTWRVGYRGTARQKIPLSRFPLRISHKELT